MRDSADCSVATDNEEDQTRFPEIVIFVGSGRSGTTYLSSVVKPCFDIGLSGEPKFVASMARRLPRYGDLREPANLRRVAEIIHKTSPVFRHLHNVIKIPSTADEILERVKEPTYSGVLYAVFQLIADKRGNSRLGYKDPLDVINLAVLGELFPTGRFVHIVRDGRDVALSLLKFQWGANNLYCGARFWVDTVTQGRRDGRTLGDRYHELRLEDFIYNTDEVAAKLGHFINRGRDEAQVQAFVDHVNATKKISSVDQWKKKLDEKERMTVEAVAGDLLRECGYETKFDGRAHVSPSQAAGYVAGDFVQRVRNRLTRAKS